MSRRPTMNAKGSSAPPPPQEPVPQAGEEDEEDLANLPDDGDFHIPSGSLTSLALALAGAQGRPEDLHLLS
jgi:hypothetical protein